MTNYLIAIGGTGSRCVESVVHLAACGLFGSDKLRVLFIDPDQSNGNLERTQRTLENYRACYQILGEGHTTQWVKTPLETLEVWTPFHGQINRSLGTFFEYEKYKTGAKEPAIGHLFDVLYTQQEREANLDVGFRGRPAIGSAVMSQLNLGKNSEEPWNTLIQQINIEALNGNFPKIFLCGSIFGGTGASGFPTVGRLLKNKLKQSGLADTVKLGGLLVLPYFQFNIPQGSDNELCARPEQFLLNTESALRYYRDQSIFDTVYLIGDQQPTEVNKFSLGKNTQCNDPHFIEFFGALSLKHFIETRNNSPVVLLNRKVENFIDWNDVPDPLVKSQLVQTTIFACTWVINISSELSSYSNNFNQLLKFSPWTGNYYKLGRSGIFGLGRVNLPELNDPLEDKALSIVTEWCKFYLEWIEKILTSGKANRNLSRLFPSSVTCDASKMTVDIITQIAGKPGVTMEAIIQKLALQGQGTHPGTHGLVTDLYAICQSFI